VGGQPFSVHAEGERVILTGTGQERREVELTAPAAALAEEELPEPVCPLGVVVSDMNEGSEEPPEPGTSPLDRGLEQLRAAFPSAEGGEA
jgi:hypothetical protein